MHKCRFVDEVPDVLPYLPSEEVEVHSKLREILHSILNLKRSHQLSLSELLGLQDKFEISCQELVRIRREFKRLNPHSTDELSQMLAEIPTAESEANLISQGTQRLKQTMATVLLQMTRQKTPTDLVVGHIDSLLQQLTRPLMEKISSNLFSLYVDLDGIHKALINYRETGAYSIHADLLPLQEQLHSFENTHVKDGKFFKNFNSFESVLEGQAVLSAKLHSCYRLVRLLLSDIDSLAPSLVPVHEKLISIYKRLLIMEQAQNATSFSIKDIRLVQRELRNIDSLRHHYGDENGGPGTFLELDASIPAGQAMVINLLENCFDLAHNLLSEKDPVNGALRPIYEQLIKYRQRLMDIFGNRHEWLSNNQIGHVHEEVIGIQKNLKTLDNIRVEGRFKELSNDIAEGQAVMHYILHKCYRLVYKILLHLTLSPEYKVAKCGKIDDSLYPSHRQLITIRRCLLELKKHAPWAAQDLLPWRMKLLSMGTNRVDNLFLPPCLPRSHIDHGNPVKKPGHDLVAALWDECYELLTEMEMIVEEEKKDIDPENPSSDEQQLEESEGEENLQAYKQLPVTNFFSNT